MLQGQLGIDHQGRISRAAFVVAEGRCRLPYLHRLDRGGSRSVSRSSGWPACRWQVMPAWLLDALFCVCNDGVRRCALPYSSCHLARSFPDTVQRLCDTIPFSEVGVPPRLYQAAVAPHKRAHAPQEGIESFLSGSIRPSRRYAIPV